MQSTLKPRSSPASATIRPAKVNETFRAYIQRVAAKTVPPGANKNHWVSSWMKHFESKGVDMNAKARDVIKSVEVGEEAVTNAHI